MDPVLAGSIGTIQKVDPLSSLDKAEKTIMTAMAPPKELVLAKTKTKSTSKGGAKRFGQ
jgi:hypothetical protein